MKKLSVSGGSASNSSFNQICSVIIAVLGASFIFLILIATFFSDTVADVLPIRFPKPISFLLISLITCVIALAAILLTKKIRIILTLRQPYVYVFFFAISLSISCFLIFSTAIIPKSDFNTYYRLAEGIVNGESFIPAYVSAFPHTISLSALLAAVFAFSGPSILAAQITGAVLSGLSVLLVYAVATKLNGRSIGAFAAFIWLINPSRIIYSCIVCTENLFNLLALGAFLIFLSAVNSKKSLKSVILFIVCGTVVALLAAVRPNGLIFLIAFLLMYFLFFKARTAIVPKKPAFLKNCSLLKPICAAAMIFAYILTGMAVDCAIEAHIDMDITENRMGYTLCVGMNKDFDGKWNPVDSKLFTDLLNQKGATAANDTLMQLGLERLSAHISDFTLPSFILRKTALMWCTDHEAFLYAASAQDRASASLILDTQNKAALLTMDTLYYALLLLSLLYILYCIRFSRYDTAMLLCCLLMLGTLAMHIPCEVASRYKNSMLPWLSILASCGTFCLGRNALPFFRK